MYLVNKILWKSMSLPIKILMQELKGLFLLLKIQFSPVK